MKIDLLNDLTNYLLLKTLPDILYISLTLSALKYVTTSACSFPKIKHRQNINNFEFPKIIQ